jgi:hypothetical protein
MAIVYTKLINRVATRIQEARIRWIVTWLALLRYPLYRAASLSATRQSSLKFLAGAASSLKEKVRGAAATCRWRGSPGVASTGAGGTLLLPTPKQGKKQVSMDLFPGLASYAVLVLCCLSVNQLRVPRGSMLPRHGINGCGGSSQWWPLCVFAKEWQSCFWSGCSDRAGQLAPERIVAGPSLWSLPAHLLVYMASL